MLFWRRECLLGLYSAIFSDIPGCLLSLSDTFFAHFRQSHLTCFKITIYFPLLLETKIFIFVLQSHALSYILFSSIVLHSIALPLFKIGFSHLNGFLCHLPFYSRLPRWLRWLSICLQCWRLVFYPWVGKIPWRREWQLQYSCLENPMDRGAWWLHTVHGSKKRVQHD